MAHWIGPPSREAQLTPQQVVDRLRLAFVYVDASREEAIEHARNVAAHMRKIGGLPEFMRLELEQVEAEGIRVIVADADPNESDTPYLWFVAKPNEGLLVRPHAVWERDRDLVVEMMRLCAAALGYEYGSDDDYLDDEI